MTFGRPKQKEDRARERRLQHSKTREELARHATVWKLLALHFGSTTSPDRDHEPSGTGVAPRQHASTARAGVKSGCKTGALIEQAHFVQPQANSCYEDLASMRAYREMNVAGKRKEIVGCTQGYDGRIQRYWLARGELGAFTRATVHPSRVE